MAPSPFTQLASDVQLAQIVKALEAHGVRTAIFDTGEEARSSVLHLLPSGAAVYNPPSRTLEQIGLAEEIEHPTRFQSVRTQLHALDRATQRDEMRRLGASPDVLVGSVHAITAQGEILVASAVGSQLGPAANSARQPRARAQSSGRSERTSWCRRWKRDCAVSGNTVCP